MASDARNTAAAAINAAISSADHNYRYRPPVERKWKVYWARYWCFKSQKREKRIVPTSRSEDASGSARGWPSSAQAGLGLVPPSSPASFVNSTIQSPASFTLSLSAVSASGCSPVRPSTMFTIGPYAHETQLVSPPVFSTFTTEPSTASFTPPPERAHLTNPSSPDVPYADLITRSFELKSSRRETMSPLYTSTLVSPCDTPVSCEGASSQYYLGSPVGRLVSPSWGYSSGEVISDGNHPIHFSASVGQTVPSFPTFDPFASQSFDSVPFAALILPCDTTLKSKNPPSFVLDEHVSVPKQSEFSPCERSHSICLEGIREQSDDLASATLETCDRDTCSSDKRCLQSDGASPLASVSEDCLYIKKVEKLHKLFEHERSEMLPTPAECVDESGDFKPLAAKDGQAMGGESASNVEADTNEVSGHSHDATMAPLEDVDLRPVIFELDQFS